MSDKKQNELVPSLIAAGNRPAPIIPRTFDDAYRLARIAKKAGDQRSEEVITTCILHGLEVGFPPMQAIEVITIINGRRCIYGDGVPALLWSHKFKLHEEYQGDGDGRVALCRVTRPEGHVIERKFSVVDAKIAHLWEKAGPWKLYPDRMLQMRARGFAARDGAADVLRGLILAEEAQDIPMRDITPDKSAPGKPVLDLPDEVSAEPSVSEHVSEAENNQDAMLTNVEGYLKLLEDNLGAAAKAQDWAEVHKIWAGCAELFEAGRMSRSDYNLAEEIFEKSTKVKMATSVQANETKELPLGDPTPAKGKKGK